MNRLITVGELRAVAIKHLVELSVQHEFFCHFFSKIKTCHENLEVKKMILRTIQPEGNFHVTLLYKDNGQLISISCYNCSISDQYLTFEVDYLDFTSVYLNSAMQKADKN